MADSDKLGLGLDDIIRLNGTNRRGGGGRGGGGGGGGGNRGFRSRGARGGGNGFRTRGGGGIPRTSNPSTGRWKHDLYDDDTNGARAGAQAQRNTGVNSTAKLLISNLDYGVTTNDIQELFEDVGAVRATHVHYDESGRSLGTAEVIFERRVDAVTAQQKYNTLNLDGRPMDIKLVGRVDGGSQPQSNRVSLGNGGGGGSSGGGGGGGRNQRSGFRNNNQQNGGRGGNRTRGGGGGKQQQNGSGGKKEDVTADDLDADLDAYRAESKQKK